MEDAWVLVGDFNCVLKADEWSSGVGVSTSFIDWEDRRGLIDHGYSGQPFTLNYGSSLETRRAARLDCGLGDMGWRQLFSEAHVHHLGYPLSDHCSVLVSLQAADISRIGFRPFKFQAAWLRHDALFDWLRWE